MTTPMREDGLFAALRRAVPKPKPRDAQENAWISATTWRLAEEIFSALRYPARDQSLIQMLGRAINAILKRERRQGTEESVEEVKHLLLLDPPIHREAWH